MHRISECWPNHFIPSGTHLNQAYFPNNSKVFPHRISVSWQNLCVPCWLICFMHTFHVIPRVSCTQSQSLVEFSSIKVGCICIELIFQDIARFQHGFSVWWRILFGPRGMRFNQAYFPWYGKVFTYRISVFWRPLRVPHETHYWCLLFKI